MVRIAEEARGQSSTKAWQVSRPLETVKSATSDGGVIDLNKGNHMPSFEQIRQIGGHAQPVGTSAQEKATKNVHAGALCMLLKGRGARYGRVTPFLSIYKRINRAATVTATFICGAGRPRLE